MKKNKFSTRLLTALLAVLMIFSVMPMSAFAAPASDIPAELLDNPILRALEYTGYDVQAQKDKGTLYQSGHYGSQLLNNDPGILSDIHYGTSTSGRETVADSSTVTGLAPDMARFENYGLCCAGFVSYFALNYLPNIEGKDTQFLTDAILATGMNSQAVVTWQTALNKLANAGKIEKVGTSSSNVDYDKMVPGDLIIFGNDESTHVHIGVYAGHYKGNAMMIHVGNDRGPEITRVDWMAQGGDKSSWPNAFYHLPDEIWEDDGDIEVYKKDTNGKALEGAVFVATNNETGNSYRIGPTNSSGYAKTENPIPYGTYTVKETVFPTNYHAYGKTEWTVTVDADNDGLVTINAVNEQDDGSVKIVKISEDGKVEGITFTVSGNGINKTVTTNAKGEIQIDGLKPGTYTVTEAVADKYEPQKSQTVTVVSNKTSTVTFNNVLKRGDLQITKTAEDGMIEGVKFHLYGTSLSGIKVDEYATTNANGVAVFKDILISGLTSYTIEEVETAEKYVIPSAQQAIIEWNDVTDNSFHNELKRGDLKITKTSEDGLVEGVKFHLYGTALNGETVDLYAVTDAMGVATFEDVLISDGNSYTVEEVDTAERYIIPASQATAIEWAKAINKEFHNELKRGDLKVTKTSEDGLVEGVTFHLYGTSLSGHTVDEYVVTNADGIAVFEDILISGHEAYILEEVDTAERYIVSDGQRAAIEWNKVTEKSFYNKLKRGNLTVQKTSEDGFDEGMTFHLYGTSFSGIEVDEYATTDENGIAYFNEILIGTGFTIEEVNTPVRYVIPEKQIANIYWDELTEVEFENILKKWRADVFKLDAELAGETGGGMPEELMPMALSLDSDSTIEQLGSPYGDTQGDATLGGAVYGVYKGAELIDTYTTDENGYFITKYYPCGDDWTIREITPSEGYLLDPTVYYMDASAEFYSIELNTIYPDVYEEIIKGDIAIIKHTDDGSTKIETPETGAKFAIFLKAAGSYDNAKETERDIIICDENGFGQTKMLPYGVYTVHQVSGWEGRELMGDFEVYISQHETTYRYLINNANFESYVRVVKVDAETDKTIPYAGAAFKIYDPDGELVTMTYTYPTPTTIDTFYTDANGSLVTPEKLEYGKGYYLVEVEAPFGYVLDSTPVYFDVTEDNSETEDSGVTVIKVNKANMAQKGTITVTKTGEVFSGVSVGGNEDTVIYQPVYEDANLAGAVFEIRAAEDIITLDGTIRYTKGEVVDTITTGANGTATSKEIYLGKYEVQEITAPHGYVLNGDIHTVELIYAGQNVSVTETATSFYNERQKATLSMLKVLETNDLFDIGSNGEIANVVFGLYAAEELVSASGTAIPADGLIEVINFDENGLATIKTDLPLGSYYVKEIATDEHYILNSDKYAFAFEYAGQEIVSVALTVNGGEAIENDLIYGSVSGKKVTEYGDALTGAVIGLFKQDETEFTADTALMTTVSAEDGGFAFENIPYGNWLVREIEQPVGFVLNDTVYDVVIRENEQVVEIEITNEFIMGDITLTKVDADYPDNKLSGATFEVYKDNNADGVIDDGDELIGTLAEKEPGVYEMLDLYYGHYLVKETAAPEGFLLDEGVYSVFIDTDEKVYVIENEAGVGFIDQPIKGNIALTKIDAEYPDNKLTGATFEVYADNNANGVLDDGDTLIGSLTESEAGVYEMTDLRYGHYLIKETAAPDGFFLDEGVYPVFIETDGTTYYVENEAGVGFINEAMKGSLKIVKTSDDGKVAGFSFRITGPNGFDVTLKTDENGEILIEGLRIGEYTVSEVEDEMTEGYILPEDKVATVTVNETVTVEMHNEREPEMPDNPQTGDNSRLGLWVGLAAASLGALIVLAFGTKKKRTKTK